MPNPMTKETPMNKEKSAVVRVHPKTYAWINKKMRKEGTTFSAFVRKLLYQRYPVLPVYEDLDTILAEGKTRATRPAEFAPYLTAAMQRVMDGIKQLEAEQAEVDRFPDEHRQAIAELKGCLHDLEQHMRQYQWTKDITQWVEKYQGDK
jgi:hypothetical protein